MKKKMLYLKMLFWTKMFLSFYPPSLSLFPLIPPLRFPLPHLLDCKVHEGNYSDLILLIAPSALTNTEYTVRLISDADFPGGSVVKKSACQCRRCGFNPSIRKILWKREWQPTPVFLPGRSHGKRRLKGYSPWGHKRVGARIPRSYAFKLWCEHGHSGPVTDLFQDNEKRFYQSGLLIFSPSQLCMSHSKGPGHLKGT